MDKIISIIEQHVSCKVSPETSIETLGLDSLEFMELLLALENEAGIQISNEKIVELVLVSDFTRLAA